MPPVISQAGYQIIDRETGHRVDVLAPTEMGVPGTARAAVRATSNLVQEALADEMHKTEQGGYEGRYVVCEIDIP